MPTFGPLPAPVPDDVPLLLERWRRARLFVLDAIGPWGGGSTHDAPQGHAAARDLASVVADASARGVIVRDPDAGWVDMTMSDTDRTQVACWREGEPMVSFRHAAEARCTSRRSV